MHRTRPPEREGSPHLVITNEIPLRDAKGGVIDLAGFSRRIENLRTALATMRSLASTAARLHEEFAEPLTTAQLAHHAHFTRAFATWIGTSPASYRRDHQQPAL